MVTATPSRRATAPALSASSATRPLRCLRGRRPAGGVRAAGRATPASHGAYRRGSARQVGDAGRPGRPSAGRRPRPGRASSGASGGDTRRAARGRTRTRPARWPGRRRGRRRRPTSVSVDRRRRRAPRRSRRLAAVGQRLAGQRVAAAGVGPAQREAGLHGGPLLQQQPARPGRPAAPRRPGAAGPGRGVRVGDGGLADRRCPSSSTSSTRWVSRGRGHRSPPGDPRRRRACRRSAPSARRRPAGCPSRRRPHWTVSGAGYPGGTGRSGRACARRRTACRRPCPASAQSAGVTTRETSTPSPNPT